ncbi:MAG: GNAT family N-acetyltransferase [Anaerolineaceae bacterium]
MVSGKRIRLRALEKSDLPAAVAWLNDPEVTENLLTDTPLSLEMEEIWYRKMLENPVEEHVLAIEMKTQDGWRLIGTTAFHHVDWKNRIGEYGIMIGEKSQWGKGYGYETTLLMLRYGFNTLNLNKVFLFAIETNSRGIRVYEKAGFVHEGRLRQDIHKNGHYLDVFVMSVLRDEWKDIDI